MTVSAIRKVYNYSCFFLYFCKQACYICCAAIELHSKPKNLEIKFPSAKTSKLCTDTNTIYIYNTCFYNFEILVVTMCKNLFLYLHLFDGNRFSPKLGSSFGFCFGQSHNCKLYYLKFNNKGRLTVAYFILSLILFCRNFAEALHFTEHNIIKVTLRDKPYFWLTVFLIC